MAKTAKALGARLKQQQAEFDDEDEDDEEGDGRDRMWGGNKKTYHGADNVDFEVQHLLWTFIPQMVYFHGMNVFQHCIL